MSVQNTMRLLSMISRRSITRNALPLSLTRHSWNTDPARPFCLSQCHGASASKTQSEYKESFYARSRKWIKFQLFQRFKLRAYGAFLYETVEQVPYFIFFKELSLPDTMNSWFLVTELHVWMLMVKAMELKDIGETLRNEIVSAMWLDMLAKARGLGPENTSLAQKQTKMMGEQFQAAIIGYDEGLQSNDMVLASAIWRRFFERNCNEAEHIESMVKYVRQQLHYLDKLPQDDFVAGKVKWPPFEKIQ